MQVNKTNNNRFVDSLNFAQPQPASILVPLKSQDTITAQSQNNSGDIKFLSLDKINLSDEAKIAISGKKICIDPGHGGDDAGSISPSGLKEKDINLKIALLVRENLERLGAKVIMTRSTDADVAPPGSDDETELGARVKVANDANADIFISIHANSWTSSLKYGHEDYYYQGAGKPSKNLAGSVYNEVVNQMKLKGNGVLTSNFYVIKYTKMPAELTEMEYLSNPEGEKKLKDPNFQKNIALAITQGLVNYFVNLKGKIPPARIPPKDKHYKQLPCEKIHK